MEQYGRRPALSSMEADTKELKNLRVQVLNKLVAPPKVIPEDFHE